MIRNLYWAIRKIARLAIDIVNDKIFCMRVRSFCPHQKLRDIGAIVMVDLNMINQFVANEALAGSVKNKIKKNIIVNSDLKMVSEMDIIIAYEDVFHGGFAWCKTAFYDRVASEIKKGKKKFGCISMDEFNRRLKEDEKHFSAIKYYGYKSQMELGSLKPWDEVQVVKCKDGSFAFIDGRHRLATARVLAVKSIPVLICGVEQ